MTKFKPTHRIIGDRGTHRFDVGTLVRKSNEQHVHGANVTVSDSVGSHTSPALFYVGEDGRSFWVSKEDLELIVPLYEDGKLYRITRTLRYRASEDRFFLTCESPVPYRGLDPANLSADPTVTVERVPDPLPTGFGAIVRKDGVRYSRVGAFDRPWRSERGGLYSNEDMRGADVLYVGDPK